jgi:ribosomal protein S18 acetylase RimI-like enzyme
MLTVPQLEVLDIRHFTGKQLRPLLEHEAVYWERRLRWDYRSSTELLLQYLDSRVLPGFVALDRGKICGFTFCVYEGQKAVVGDAYSIGSEGNSAIELTRMLLMHLLEVLMHAPNISRVESQLLLYDEGTTSAVFNAQGFSIYQRLFMDCDLRFPSPALIAMQTGSPSRPLPGGLLLRQWSGTYYQAAAELIHLCYTYAPHVDSIINDQYRSLHGSLRFLHNIVRFPGCGVFEPNASWLLVDPANGQLAGLVLASRVAPKVAHITQLCISPTLRGHGLAESLLVHAMNHLVNIGFDTITLTVTTANDPAVRLYEKLAFVTTHRFDAMVIEKTPGSSL